MIWQWFRRVNFFLKRETLCFCSRKTLIKKVNLLLDLKPNIMLRDIWFVIFSMLKDQTSSYRNFLALQLSCKFLQKTVVKYIQQRVGPTDISIMFELIYLSRPRFFVKLDVRITRVSEGSNNRELKKTD